MLIDDIKFLYLTHTLIINPVDNGSEIYEHESNFFLVNIVNITQATKLKFILFSYHLMSKHKMPILCLI